MRSPQSNLSQSPHKLGKEIIYEILAIVLNTFLLLEIFKTQLNCIVKLNYHLTVQIMNKSILKVSYNLNQFLSFVVLTMTMRRQAALEPLQTKIFHIQWQILLFQ